jgi:hypothetical protein
MNSKSTWIWLAVAAVLFAAVAGVEKYGRKPAPALVALLPDFRAAAVTGVEFTPAGQVEIRADRTNGTWQLVRPLTYPAQAASIEVLLATLQQLAPAHIITPAEIRARKNSDAEFGFDRRAALTLFTGDSGQQLIIGADTAPGDQLYLQVVGNESVFVVDGRLRQLLPRTADDWRDTKLVELRPGGLDWVSVSNATTRVQLRQESTNSPWRLTSPLTARADNYRLAEQLQRLQTARVVQFVTDQPRGAWEAYGLHAPELEILLGKGTNVVSGLQFGGSPTNDSTLVYARRVGFDSVVTVERAALAPWLVPLDKFRDPHLVSRHRQVDRMEVRGRDGFVVERTGTNAWKLVDSELPADALFVGQFLAALATAPIVEFQDSITDADLGKYGLDQPTRQIVLRGKPAAGSTNSLIAELALGGLTGKVAYARRADENPVYGIRAEDYAVLLAAPWQLRDRKVWSFSETNLVRILAEQGETKVEVRRAGKNVWVYPPDVPGELNGGALEEVAVRFSQLESLAWVAQGATDRARLGFSAQSLRVTFELRDGTKHQVEFGGRTPDNYPYAMVELGGKPWYFESSLVAYELLNFALFKSAQSP